MSTSYTRALEHAQETTRQPDGRIIELRENYLTLQEIADETGTSRLDVFRCLLRLDRNSRLRLGVPT